ncbi:hypothetical protein CHS0354_032667 [Potamilus streckersoni]|uniref:Innexin n=1 Tax=Potamilus streckersoni TaxID=2493646 RepID=A0AAE0TEZ2_9BIVA|nr:hypothetical protein CHS0354_032667 [Potamilus streckersoni]
MTKDESSRFWQRRSRSEDVIDRLNHVWTFLFLIMVALIITWRIQQSDRIQCWSVQGLIGDTMGMVQSVCWGANRMIPSYGPSPNNIHGIPTVRHFSHWDPKIASEERATLYQWIPVLLCLQALLFKLPDIVFTMLNSYSSLSCRQIVALVNGYQYLSISDREILVRRVATFLHERFRSSFLPCSSWGFLSFQFLLLKLMYCVNAICQIVYIDSILVPYKDVPANSYGDVVFGNLRQTKSKFWKHSPSFPQSVICNFTNGSSASSLVFSTQCEIHANQFSEQVLMVVWLWLLFVSIVTCLGFVSWLVRSVVPIFRSRFIKRYMDLDNVIHIKRRLMRDLARFTDSHLGQDGIIIIQLIGRNSSEVFVKHLVRHMFNLHQEFLRRSRRSRMTMLEAEKAERSVDIDLDRMEKSVDLDLDTVDKSDKTESLISHDNQ